MKRKPPDLPATSTQRVSVTSAGAQVPYASQTRPRISGNGRYVALSSTSSLDGSNSGGAFLVDTSGSAVSRIDPSTGEVDLDDAGRFLIHADFQVTLLDRVVENTTFLGTGTFPSISADGRYNVYASGKRITARGGGSEIDAIVDRNGTVLQVTPLRRPELSGNGRWIVFSTSEWPGYLGRFVIVRLWNRARERCTTVTRVLHRTASPRMRHPPLGMRTAARSGSKRRTRTHDPNVSRSQ